MDKARETAVRILYEVHENGAYANVALAKALRQAELGEQDRRFVTELVYGAVKAGGTLDWILRRYVNRPVRKIQPLVREILRLGLYQLFYLDKVPASAACNTAVELAKGMGMKGLAGFVNAVLRTAVREPEKAAFPSGKGHATENLALSSQHPEWLVRLLSEQYGQKLTQKICQADNADAPISVRVNTMKCTPAEAQAELEAAGLTVQPHEAFPEILLCSGGDAAALPAFIEGRMTVQDAASALAAAVADPKPGSTVLDCCAAPGGKSFAMAEKMQGKGSVTSCDIYEHKLKRIRDGAARLGLPNIRTELQDACPIAYGAVFSAWAEALSRDRWRVFKCEERLRVVNLGESSVDLVLQAFASNDDYIEARSNLTEAVRNQLIEHGLNIPYPQRDLHVYHRDADGRPIADILLRGVADDGDATQTSGAAPASKS